MISFAFFGEAGARKLTWLLLLTLGAIFAGLATPGFSQTAKVAEIGGMRTTLPTIPLREPRPAEGPAAGEQWQVVREGLGRAPVASFVETLQHNDAALEVIVGQGRLMTLKADIVSQNGTAVVAVGDPSIVGFEILPNPRMIRLIGKRPGVTDLSVITSNDQTYTFEVHVVYDLELLRVQLLQVFPDAFLKLSQIREHLIIEGEARSPVQISQIIQTAQAYLDSVSVPYSGGSARSSGRGGATGRGGNDLTPGVESRPYRATEMGGRQDPNQPPGRPFEAYDETGGDSGVGTAYISSQIINLLRVPGPNQVLLQVKIAELNRTALREIGADILGVSPRTGNIFGTQIAGGTISALGALGLGGLGGIATGGIGSDTTAFGIFPSGDWEILFRALRRNSLVSILAEPNLMAMSGHEASFLAGGQFPVPVPQSSGGISNTITIEWKDFGVLLTFVPTVLDDEMIRLEVSPEVSTIDDSLGIVLEGFRIPGVNTRKASTTVELRQGQTLALAGLLNISIDANTSRIPGLGDLPYIGPMFSNTSHKRVEKELLVMVTPYLVQPMDCDQVPCLPTDGIDEPNDLEFYLMNRIEGRTGRPFRSTTNWDNPLRLVEHMKLEKRCISGPVGFTE